MGWRASTLSEARLRRYDFLTDVLCCDIYCECSVMDAVVASVFWQMSWQGTVVGEGAVVGAPEAFKAWLAHTPSRSSTPRPHSTFQNR